MSRLCELPECGKPMPERTSRHDSKQRRYCSSRCAARAMRGSVNGGAPQTEGVVNEAIRNGTQELAKALFRYGLKNGRGLPGIEWPDLVDAAYDAGVRA